MPPKEPERMYTPQELIDARLIPGINSVGALYNWRMKGIGPEAIKTSGKNGTPGGRIAFTASAIQAYIDGCPRQAAG